MMATAKRERGLISHAAVIESIARLFLLLLLCVVASGCHFTGPRSIRTGRGNYNIAIQQTSNEQLSLPKTPSAPASGEPGPNGERHVVERVAVSVVSSAS